MDLERRVEALEKELQILKAQIQTTLLDIQEQILTNAYPTLRAENAAPERPAAPAAAPITILAAHPEAAAQPAQSAQPPAAAEDTGINVRKVTLSDHDDAPPEPPAREQSSRRENSVQAVQDLDLTGLSRLEDWATEKLEHMGVARTKQLIRMYAEQGRFSPDVEATLLKFVSIYEETTGPLPSLPARSNGSRKSAPTARNAGVTQFRAAQPATQRACPERACSPETVSGGGQQPGHQDRPGRSDAAQADARPVRRQSQPGAPARQTSPTAQP